MNSTLSQSSVFREEEAIRFLTLAKRLEEEEKFEQAYLAAKQSAYLFRSGSHHVETIVYMAKLNQKCRCEDEEKLGEMLCKAICSLVFEDHQNSVDKRIEKLLEFFESQSPKQFGLQSLLGCASKTL